MTDVLFWTGLVTYVICSVIGLFWLIDKIAEWLVDSARFKTYVVGYIRGEHARDKERERCAQIADEHGEYPGVEDGEIFIASAIAKAIRNRDA